MKKFYFYGMVIVCLFCTATVHAQNRFWRLAAGTPGNWNDAANWSTISGGGGGASVPNGAGFHAIFDNGATVNVNLDVSLDRITVSGATLVRFIAAATDPNIVVTNGALGSEGLRIEAGSTLEMNCPIDEEFSFDFANNSRGVIEGTWDFTGAGTVNLPSGSTFTVPVTTGFTNRLDINNGGIIRFGNNTRIPTPGPGGAAYIFFNSGSTYWLNRNGGAVIPANWNANSTLRVTGVVNQAPNVNIGSSANFGHIIWDCPAMMPDDDIIVFPLHGIIVNGNLSILNTNNQPLSVLNVPGIATEGQLTVLGNVNISGTSEVYIGDRPDRAYDLSVAGDFNLSGGSFLMQFANGVGTNTTKLSLQGDLNHSGGTFGCASTDQSATDELFVVEMNGTGAQTITSTGTIDNAQNMITLRINNAAGVSLSSPVAVGKLSWNSANKGILTTTNPNFLTIRNPDATAATVVNAPGTTGYVSGPVRRLTNSTGTYRFPTGKGGVYRFSEVIPSTTASSAYTAEYFNTAYSSLFVQNPLTGVSNVEYWEITRNSGSAASVQLTLNGAVPGATPSDGIVVAQYLGVWIDQKGTTGTAVTPGTATTGTCRSMPLSSFSPFTLGFGPASALPVDLVSFNAKKVSGNAALLTWTVTASSTPDRFDVLRSTDGNNFSSIGTVHAVAQQVNYDFTDNNLPAGNTYYRLRLIDVNGQAKLSKVVVITGDNVNGLFLTSMAPTIVTSRARVNVASSEAGNLQLVITDMYGRIVKQQINGIDSGNQEIWLNLHTLPAGSYSITGYMNGKRSSTIRFVKQ